MAEPHSTVLAGALQASVASSVTILLGAQVDALVLGLFGAILASIWMESIDNKGKAAAAVLLSALLAGYGSPVAAEYIAASINGITITDPLRLLMALMIGALAPTAVPMVIRFCGKRMGGAA